MLRKKYIILISILIIVSLLFLVSRIYSNYLKFPNLVTTAYVKDMLKGRVVYLLVLLVSITLIVTTSLIFQTITQTRILTPSVLGFDVIYVATQTSLVLSFGIGSVFIENIYVNFFINAILLIGISQLIFLIAIKKKNMFYILMIGIIITTLMSSFSTFMQAMISPENFDYINASVAASIRNVNTNLFYISLPITVFIVVYFYRRAKLYDVASLGEDNAINLGVDYHKEVRKSLVFISIAMSLSTALIGPLAFVGLLSVNFAREFGKTYKHTHLIVLSTLVGCIFVLVGQMLVDEFSFIPSLSTVVNIIGGVYVIRLILKENIL